MNIVLFNFRSHRCFSKSFVTSEFLHALCTIVFVCIHATWSRIFRKFERTTYFFGEKKKKPTAYVFIIFT